MEHKKVLRIYENVENNELQDHKVLDDSDMSFNLK